MPKPDINAILSRVLGAPALDLDAIMDQILVPSTMQQKATPESTPGHFVRVKQAFRPPTRLENTQGTHNKFWEGWLGPSGNGVMFYARWGRIGSSGQSGQWYFDDQKGALRRLEKKVKEKQSKGYRQVGGPRSAVVPDVAAQVAAIQVAGQPISVMLAKTWKGKRDPKGWHMSEKLDGMRAYWTGKRMLTRNGNPIHLPTWLEQILPRTVLDGELWLGPGRLREVVSVARKSSARDPRWGQVRYMVFDAPEAPGGCEQRFTALRKIVKTACDKWKGQGPCPVVFVEQTVCRSRAQLTKFHHQIVKRGGEGAMLRAPQSPYTRSRTADLLKVITRERAEARITGHAQGTGRNKGRLGSYEAAFLDTDVGFKVGTGLTDDDRYNPLSIGTIITIEFKGRNADSGKPREPAYIGPRDYE